MKAKGKTHVCFPNRRLYRPVTPLQAASATSNLTLAVPAVIALAAPLLVHHRIAAALRAEIARRL